jgi:ZIP family zinc transporter
MSPITAGLLGSLGAGLLTAVGALPVLALRTVSESVQRTLLAFAAGVMLAAAFFSLIVPGIDVLRSGGAHRAVAAAVMAGAVLVGAAAVGFLNRRVALSIDAVGTAGRVRTGRPARDVVRRLWLFVAAITLHNLPEGMAVGVSFGGGDYENGLSTALGIGIQNIPEGLATATALIALGYSRVLGFAGALASGLVEPVGGLIGVFAVASVPALLPVGLGFAGGAMVYVVTAEMIPHTQRRAEAGRAIAAFMVGLVGMMFLDVALG